MYNVAALRGIGRLAVEKEEEEVGTPLQNEDDLTTDLQALKRQRRSLVWSDFISKLVGKVGGDHY